MEQVTVSVEIVSVTWAKPDGSFSIVRTNLEKDQPVPESVPRWLSDRGSISVVGNLGVVQRGDIFDVVGVIEHHSRFGKQLKAFQAERCVKATDRAIQAFLRSFPQIGPKRAKQITEHFGGFEGVIEVLDNEPARLTEIEGITDDRACAITDAYRAAAGRRDALLFTAELQLSQRLAAKVIDKWQGHARRVITDDPYALMDLRGVTFRDADDVAKRCFNVADDDPRRTAAAAMHVLAAATLEGHVYSTFDHLTGPAAARGVHKAVKTVGVSHELLQSGLEELTKERTVDDFTLPARAVCVEGRYYPAVEYNAEQAVVGFMARLMQRQ